MINVCIGMEYKYVLWSITIAQARPFPTVLVLVDCGLRYPHGGGSLVVGRHDHFDHGDLTFGERKHEELVPDEKL